MLVYVFENLHVKNLYTASCALVLTCGALTSYSALFANCSISGKSALVQTVSQAQQTSLKTSSQTQNAALRDCNQVARRDLNNLAVKYINTNKFASAICLLEKSIEIDPSYELGLFNLVTAYWNLALAQYKNKEYQQSHETLHRLKPYLNKMKNKPAELKERELHWLLVKALRS